VVSRPSTPSKGTAKLAASDPEPTEVCSYCLDGMDMRDGRGARSDDGRSGPARTRQGGSDAGVESNARLTGSTAAVLLVLLAAEGVTVLRVHALLTPHVFIGMLLIPPVLLKIGSTGWRFVRYYRGSAAYRHKGPPPAVLRLLGPVVVILTVVLLASGVGLLVAPHSLRHTLLFVHKASFVLWFAAMTVHVLGHLVETARLAPKDWVRRTRRDVAGASGRQWALAASLIAGVVLGVVMLGPTAHYRNF
jgi:hypothetical protein